MSDRTIVIGAGVGGLSAAIRLAAAGKEVVVFEQNAQVGGKMGELRLEGYRWDTGPSVITMRQVLEDLFREAGRRLDDYLTLRPVEPLTRYFYPDGVILDATRDLPAMAAQIERFDPRDVEGYLRFLAYAARIHRITGPVFITSQPPTLASFARVPPVEWPQIDPFRTMAGSIRRFVRSSHLRQLLGRFATYVGASPYQAPATLNVIAHVELTGGIWYPEGGVYAIGRALERLAGELGVTIQTGCRVAGIDIKAGSVVGVRLEDGSHHSASRVIANVDVATVYEKLLPESAATRRRLARLSGAGLSCSGFILLLGVEGTHPELAHHNIFFSPDYRREFDQIFGQEVPADEPTIYAAITARADPADAPAGHENWFVLVNAPPVGPGTDWEREAVGYRDRVLERLAGFGYDVRGKIRVERVLTPLDIARQSGARRGALYGISSNHALAAFRRPHNRASDVSGLYFVGGTTHPGGGLPMVMLSGRVVASLILEG